MSHNFPLPIGIPELTSYREAPHLNIQMADSDIVVTLSITSKSAFISKSSPAAFLFSTSVKAP
jgi:hypothetical protein